MRVHSPRLARPEHAELRDSGRADYVTATDDEHDPEGSTIAYERSQLGALIQQAERHLLDIRDALERLGSGRYGVCERCGAAIPVPGSR